MILVINCGSQSIKYKLFEKDLQLIKEGRIMVGNKKEYAKVLENELKKLASFKDEIGKVCHRFVCGGEKFRAPIKINKKILKELEKYSKLAPLHNPYNVLGIKASLKIFPKAKEIAVFDTGFFENLPARTTVYPLPEQLRKKYGFKRFGFHGISHEYVAKEGAKKIGRFFKKLNIITCHLGGGASITAIKSGRAMDTSMGFTPLEGLVMMTRSGDIDPGILLLLGEEFSFQKLNEILNNLSGIKGISGFSEMKDVLKAIKKRDKNAKLALDIFVYRIQKYIGSYFAVLGKCDLLVFTGAIGEGSQKIRRMILRGLTILKNTKILVIKTDEELMIAKKSKKL
jgi:acetate kinase